MARIILIQPKIEYKEPSRILFHIPLLRQFIIPPIGLIDIASYLRHKGFNAEILDANLKCWNHEKVCKFIQEKGADFVGLGINVSSLNETKKIISLLRKKRCKTKIIAGGPICTTNPDLVIDMLNPDFVISGDGEIPFEKIITLKGNKSRLLKEPGINIVYNGKKIINGVHNILNMDSLPYRDWSLIDIKKYRPSAASFRKLPAITTIESRGCPYSCSFCTQANPKIIYKERSAAQIEDELQYFKKCKIKDINFFDDNFTLRRSFSDVLSLLKKYDFIWNCSTRVDLVNKEILKEMKKAGCYEIGYGIESGSQKTLDRIKKGISLEQIRKTVSLTREVGIDVKAYLQVGYIDETADDIKESIRFVTSLKPDILSMTITTPLAGSPYWERLKIKDLRQLTYWSGDSISNYLSYEQLLQILKNANRKYYLSPDFIFRFLCKIRSFEDIKRTVIAVGSSL